MLGLRKDAVHAVSDMIEKIGQWLLHHHFHHRIQVDIRYLIGFYFSPVRFDMNVQSERKG